MSEFFIRRPIVAMVIAIITVLIGVVSLAGLPIAQFPQILPPQVNLTTTYTGADALTIEQSVATPIEQNMNGVDRMLYIQSTNANDGSMSQVVTFDVGTDGDVNNVLVNNRFSQAQPLLPQDVKNFRRDDQEVARVSASRRVALLAGQSLRPDVSSRTTRSSTSTTRFFACPVSATYETSARPITRCAFGSTRTCSRVSSSPSRTSKTHCARRTS